MNIGWVYHEDYLKHDPGPTHPECPDRLRAIVAALDSAGLLARMKALPIEPVDPRVLTMVHDPAYVALVQVSCRKGMGFVGSPETRVCGGTFKAALRAVGGVVAACDAIMKGEIQRAFCAVRPPGHHAGRDYAEGFCLFNNVALAAEHLVQRHKLERVAIVDFDVHHGNGTQHIFEQRNDVLYISLHEDPRFLYPGTGHADETGIGQGTGFTLNIPMLPGSDDAAYRKAFAQRVLPRLDEFKPQFLLVSSGFDAVHEEEIAHIDLTPDSYDWITRDLMAAADKHCGGRLVSILEGGYELPILGQCAVVHVKAMLNGSDEGAAAGMAGGFVSQ
jgi:acetoin utilization deacetylase AcuC-like enzyme